MLGFLTPFVKLLAGSQAAALYKIFTLIKKAVEKNNVTDHEPFSAAANKATDEAATYVYNKLPKSWTANGTLQEWLKLIKDGIALYHAMYQPVLNFYNSLIAFIR